MKDKIMLERFEKRFFEVMDSKEPVRTNRLANLMTDMEGAFEIPLVGADRIKAFRINYPVVMRVYRMVSDARNLEGVR